MALLCLAVPAGAADGKQGEPPTSEPSKGIATEALTIEAINGATFTAPETSVESEKAGSKTASEGEKTTDARTAKNTKPPKRRKTDKPKAATDKSDKRPQPLLVKVQVLLDRAHFSPGAIDGLDGENMRGALSAFAVAQGLPPTKALNRELFDKLAASSSEPVVTSYTVTDADVAGPFVEKIPPKMEEQADLEAMSYTNPREMLAERFHMSRDLVSALNPDAALDKSGTVVTVAAVPPLETGKPTPPVEAKAKSGRKSGAGDSKDTQKKDIARIEVDKVTRHVRGFGEDGTLRAYYPASIGSEEKPAPSGEAKVKGVAFSPWYTYNPKYRFKGVSAKTRFSIHPGPNNPVGIVWIDLSIPSYGIHGTPEPEKVGKTESHGCIRLTNWDARDLASRVERGAKVTFKDE
ncbi:L,D-transpeptidase [Methylobacterium sp. 77]|uniref:L,D-transpeptidase family protein n=1 Tax=Methylobacterium sp. 77 TaxID=1101192 RepID=UPI00037CA968|nr:L,D-transpeptidase [Methylobacterium sp. 77]